MTSPIPSPSLLQRTLSKFVAMYPPLRGQTRLRNATGTWLVSQLPCGAWVRVSGVVDAEWNFFAGQVKEDATTEIVRSFLRPGSTFVDVGSNIGYFTLLAASLGAHVVAYEPTPNVFNRLRENVSLNHFQTADLVNAAVAEKPGTLTLYQSADDPEANNLFGEGEGCIEVPAVKLDEDLQSRGISRVDLLKIDAEGAEPLVLDGAAQLLSSATAPIIVIELNPVALRNANFVPADILDRLESYGYRCSELEQCLYKGEVVVNILATPRSTMKSVSSAAIQ